MIIKPKYKWRDEFLTARATAGVNATNLEPGSGVRTVTDTETCLSIVPKVGTAIITQTGVTFGGSNNRCSYGPTSWMDFPYGFDAAAHAGLGRIVIMFDSAGVGCWAWLGAAGTGETGETLGDELLTDPSFNNAASWSTIGAGWVIAGGNCTATAVNATAVSQSIANYQNYLVCSSITASGAISGTCRPMVGGSANGEAAISSGTATGYRSISGSSAVFGIYGYNPFSGVITEISHKLVLTPSATGVYTYKDAALTTAGWNKPTAFNMNSASYTFGIYEPQSRGRLFFMGWRQASWTWGDPGYWNTESVTRKRGLVCAWKVNFKTINGYTTFGLSIAKSSNIAGPYIRFVSNYIGASSIGNIETAVANTDFYFAIVLRDSGASYFVKKSTNTWKYCGQDTIGNAATYYPGIAGYSLVGYCDWIRQSNYLWMPKPLISDNFAGTDGDSADGRVSNGLGHAETTGLGSGGAGVVWAGSTATVATNRLVITPTLGAEIATGNTVVGSWYSITATEADHFFTGCAVGNTFHCTTAKSLDANNKVKEITLSSCWYVAALDTADVTLSVKFIMSGVNQCGIVMALDDAGNNFVLLYRDGLGSVTLKIFESGTTYTAKASTAIAYSADTELSLRRDATGIWGYYNNGLVGSGPTTTLSAGENTNLRGLKIGCFSTAATNSFSSAVVQHTGTNGEIDILSRLIGA